MAAKSKKKEWLKKGVRKLLQTQRKVIKRRAESGSSQRTTWLP